MKTALLTATLTALVGSAAFAETFIPPIGEQHALESTPRQKAAEALAVRRRHDAILEASVEAARARSKDRLADLLARLLKEGTAGEKAEFAASAGQAYTLPRRLQPASDEGGLRLAFDRGVDCRAKRCVESSSEQVCNNRTVCRVVCQGVAGGVGGAIGGRRGGAIGSIGGGEVCGQVCDSVPECRTVTTCLRYEFSGPGCF